jgi:5-methylthioribose kinase
MKLEYKYNPSLIPRVYYYDPELTLTIMQYLDPPHIILRKGLLRGTNSTNPN